MTRHGLRTALSTTVALLLATVTLLASQPVAPTDNPVDNQTLTLDDLEALDALIEEDTTEAASIDRGTLVDVAGLSVVLAFALYSFVTKSERLKVITLVVSVAYLGFFKASLVSIVDVFGALSFSLPELSYAIPYYLLIGFTLATTVLWGRLYCGRICAFGALTQLLDRVVPSRLRWDPPVWIDRRLSYVKYAILLSAVVYYLASRDPLVYRYIEPFWMFTLNGNTLMWTLLGILLVATVFVRNLYCRYLCAVGAGLGLLSSLTVFRIKRWKECQTCTLCEKVCEWGAIQGPRISLQECVRCDDCERLYADESKCPHWLIAKRAAARTARPTP